MTCQTHTTRCDVCGRPVCDRCARCYEKQVRKRRTKLRCPSRRCRLIKTLKRVVG